MDDEVKVLTDEELETSFSSDAYKMYFKEICRYPVLSLEHQKELAKRYIENADLKAKEMLINCNLRLVVSVANHYKERLKHLQILDVIQEGNLGLIRAIETYDPDQGAFTTYAIPWIKQRISRGLAEQNEEIRKPVHIVADTTRYLKFVNRYEKRNLKLPDDEVICDILDISIDKLKSIRETLLQTPVSINQMVGDDGETELENFVVVESNDYDDVLNNIVNDNLFIVLKEILTPVQYFVIYHRILSEEQKSLEQIASHLNLTRERVRQIESKALEKIKPYIAKDSAKFKNTLSKIKVREKGAFKLLKKTPLAPTQIIRYMYLKDDLTNSERKLYELMLLGKYDYRDRDYACILEISLSELEQLKICLKEKINKKFSDVKAVKNFQNQMIKEYGTKIFNIVINKNEKIINFYELQEKYSSLSLEEILEYFKEIDYYLTPAEEKLLKKYFGTIDIYPISKKLIEKEVNILKFDFRKKDKRVPIKKLYQEYLKIKNSFNQEQQLYLETYIFNKKDKNLFKQNYPNSSIHNKSYLIDILEKSYYHIHEYFENDFTKENWIYVKEKYRASFTEKRVKILDLYYGVNGKTHTITELAQLFNEDYDKMRDICRQARDFAINLYCGITRKLDIDKSLYAPYVMDYNYQFTNETRNVLKLFILDDKTYDEISEKTSLNKTRISNIITEGIRKIDNYRFKIIKCFIISEDELNDFFEHYKDKITDGEKEIIRLKHLKHMENKDIAHSVNKPLLEVNRLSRRFNYLYESYLIRNIELTNDDIKNEILKHKSESVWTKEQKVIASFYNGIKCDYNPDGVILSTEEIMQKLGYKKHAFYHICTNMIKTLKLRKTNFIKPENNYIEREKLDILLDDVHLPISDKEREIICHLFELKGLSYKTISELALKYSEKKGSIIRRYQRAIVSIYKYLNNEIDGSLDYETDIASILKYFGISDRMKIIDFYKNNLTYEEIAKKYDFTFDQIVIIMNRIKVNIKNIMTNTDAKKFDFDYYLKEVNNPDLPFTGDLNLAKQIFDLVFGMSGERMSLPLVLEKPNLDCGISTINKTFYNLMLSVCKLKDGITKDKTFTYEQVYTYYLNNYDKIPDCYKKDYYKYFETLKKYKSISGQKGSLSYNIISDLIIDTYKDAFNLDRATKEEVLDILKEYGNKLNKRVRKDLMRRYDISERMFMNGKDINHVFKLLNTLDSKRIEFENQSFVLKK